MQWFSLMGAVISAVAVAAAYRIGYAAGHAAGQEAGYCEGKRAGTKEGSVRGFAVGYDRGKRSVHQRDTRSGEHTQGLRAWQPALLVLGAGILVILLLSAQRSRATQPPAPPASVSIRGQ